MHGLMCFGFTAGFHAFAVDIILFPFFGVQAVAEPEPRGRPYRLNPGPEAFKVRVGLIPKFRWERADCSC